MIKIRTIYGTASVLSKDRMEQVQAIFKQTFPSLSKYADRLPSLLREPVHHGYRTVLIVAEGALGRVDGFALVIHFHEIKTAFLDFIATRPDMRGGGVGGALYEAVRELCLNSSVTGLYMEVEPDEPELITDQAKLDNARRRVRFYEQYGVRVIDGTAYATPVGDPPTTALLLYDGLGSVKPPGKKEARQAVEMILTRRFRHIAPPEYVRLVVNSFNDDPVTFRPFRYVKKTSEGAKVKTHRLSPAFAMVNSPKHEIHHVKERGYFERPVRIGAIQEALVPTGLFLRVTPREYGDKYLLAVHEPDFVRYLQTVCTRLKQTRAVYPDTFPIRRPERRPRLLPVQAGYYCIDTGTPLYPNAYIAARAAVNTALTSADEILSGRRLAFAVCRPPGHHAGKRFYGGFCYFNNAAIAAHYLSSQANKIAILDIDFHHGNGTQDIFYERSDVLTVSIHGHPDYAYPYFSGYEDETGTGAGKGFNLNLPLPPKTGEKKYLTAFTKAVESIEHFNPDILVVSIGFDIMKGDPTGTFMLSIDVFRELGLRIMEIERPVLVVQEGGYNLRNIKRGSVKFFEGCAAGLKKYSIESGQHNEKE